MMMYITRRTIGTALCGLLVCAAMLLCGGNRIARAGQDPVQPRGLTLVMPFVDMAKVFGSHTSVRSPVSSKVFSTDVVHEDASHFLSNELYRLIGREKQLIWGAVSNDQDLMDASGSGSRNGHLAHLIALGRRKGADTILAGYVYAFRDKQGGNYGVEEPARVVFELALISIKTGSILWQSSFKETQQPLSENLLQLKTFIKRKGRWVSAWEMATTAMREMLRSEPRFNVP